MKMSLLSAAVGAAVLGAAGSAYALPPANYAGAVKLFYGGATATDNLLVDLLRAKDSVGNSICDSGTIDVWRATNQYVVLCHTSNPALGNFDIAFSKESEGGSDRGVAPLVATAKGQAQTLQWLDAGSLNAADVVTCGSVTVAGLTASGITVLASYTNHATCPMTIAPDTHRTSAAVVKPNGGVADVDPPLLRPLTPAADVSANIDVLPAIQVVFGVPVSLSLYKALQQAEGITLGLGSCTAVAPIENNPTCVPTMTKSQLAAIVTQQVVDWGAFTDIGGTPLPASPLVSPALKPADPIPRICRRVQTSGTEAAGENYFTNGRCTASPGATVPIPDDASNINDTVNHPWNTTTNNIDNSSVNANVSSGNLRTCLDIVEHHGRSDGIANGAPLWGVGFLSTEVTAGNLSGAHDSFRFVAINGSAPTLANAINGDYDFYTDDIFTHIKTGKTGAATGTALTLQQYIESHVQDPVLLANLDIDFAGRPWGQGGLLIPPNHGAAATPPVSPVVAGLTNVRAKMSHTGAGGIANCGASTTVDSVNVTLHASDATPLDNLQQKN